MARFLIVVLTVYALLAGAFAVRGGPLLARSDVPAGRFETRMWARARHVAIPSQPRRLPPRPVAHAMLDTLPVTVVAKLRLRGDSRWIVVRATPTGEAIVVSAPDGRIATFARREAARAWADRALRTPPLPPVRARFVAELGREFERAGLFDCDLDAAYTWATTPRRDGRAAELLLADWTLLAMAGELPPVTPGDPMGITQARGTAGSHALTDAEELEVAMAKVDLVVRLAQRERKRPGDPLVTKWPPAPYWSDADAARVGGAMRPAIAALVARLAPDVDDVARALTSASR